LFYVHLSITITTTSERSQPLEIKNNVHVTGKIKKTIVFIKDKNILISMLYDDTRLNQIKIHIRFSFTLFHCAIHKMEI